MRIDDRSLRVEPGTEAEVLVAGGGFAGVAAALAAARSGCDTLLVEQFNCLGGVATSGGHGHLNQFSAWGTDQRVVGGIPFEIAKRIVEEGYGALRPSCLDFEVEGMKLVLQEMVEESGVRVLFHTFLVDALLQGGSVRGGVVVNKDGATAIKAKRTVDCTGDGDVAARAGCSFHTGDEGSGYCQPATLMFTVGGVDHDRFEAFMKEDPELKKTLKRALEEGGLPSFQNQIMGMWWVPSIPDQLGVNFTHINFVDSTRAQDLTRATMEGRRQAYQALSFLREHVPGLEKGYISSTPSVVGIRESRRVVGEYQLGLEDLLEERRFPDSIGYGSFFIDIHNVRGPGMDPKTIRPRQGFKYQIPYRILVPRDVEDLLVAGKCVSCTHEALGSLRVMAQCAVMGEAAGVAAALSIHEGVRPRELDIACLREELRRRSCIVGGEDLLGST